MVNVGWRTVLIGMLPFCLGTSLNQENTGRPKPLAETAFFKSHDGSSIHYQIAGKGRPALLFIHGWVGDATYWEYQLGPFSRCFKVLALDLPGHGRSTPHRITWEIASFTKDVVTLILQLNLKDIILIGHDMGGVVAVETAARLPKRVAGIIGVESLVDTRADPSATQARAILRRLREDYENTVHQLILDSFADEADTDLVRRISEAAAKAPPKVALAVLEQLLDHDMTEALSKVKGSILILNTHHNPPNLLKLKTVAPHIEAWETSWEGHFGFLEEPQQFNQTLNRAIDHLLDRMPQARNARETSCSIP